MPEIEDAITGQPDGAILSVEVTPGAKEDRFPAGFNPWRKTVGCRVTAPALEGRANAAVVAAIAQYAGLPKTSVSILAGGTSSVKKVRLSGIGRDDLAARIRKDLAR